MPYRSVVYAPEHREAVLRLQRHLWSPDVAKNDRYMRWKYETNPYWTEDPVIALVLDESGRVVAMQGAYGGGYSAADGQLLHGLWTGDLVVEPEHRRRGLAKLTHETLRGAARDRGVRCFFNGSSGRLSRHLYLAGGWSTVGEIHPYRLHAVGEGKGPDGFAEVDVRVAGGAIPDEHGIAVSDRGRPEAMAGLSETAGDGGRIVARKDPAYFRWRFSNPLCHYRFFFAHGAGEGGAADGSLTGWAVLHAHGPEHDTGFNIVDWDAATPAVADALLDAILSARGEASISIWPDYPGSRLVASLEERGFEPAPTPPPPRVLPALLVTSLVDDGVVGSQADPGGGEPGGELDGVGDLPLEATAGLDAWDLRMVVSDYY